MEFQEDRATKKSHFRTVLFPDFGHATAEYAA